MQSIENSARNNYLCNELAYEKDLKERMTNYDSESPTYVTSATDGGRYIKITKMNSPFTMLAWTQMMFDSK